jgi:type I restriction enzyme S subunit
MKRQNVQGQCLTSLCWSQSNIVGRLEALSAETKRLEEIYTAKVQSLEELKQSVLRPSGEAFAGEL